MRIQLLLANQEVELTKDVQIPLNKAFQNLWNPTDIIVDYSKTISIPMTVINNRVLGNAYRLDRTILSNIDQLENIGLYLDPTKKIPFNLLYNGQELMNGYAKFTSANYSKNNKSYNLNLFGALGEYFQSMKDVVTSFDRLTDEQKSEEDGGSKYVLNDHIGDAVLNSEYVKKSWQRVNNNINNFSDPNVTDQDIIGFAPAYRGYYGMDFKSTDYEYPGEEIVSIVSDLESCWKNTYCINTFDGKIYHDCTDDEKKEADDFISKLEADKLVEDGMKEYQMGQYRSYHQRPFIYLNKLMYMFQEKSKALTGYDLELDPSWFNENNPYWTKLVYTLNYLEDIEEIPNTQQYTPIQTSSYTLYQTPTDSKFGSSSYTYSFTPHSSIVDIQSTIAAVKLKYDNRSSGLYSYGLMSNKNTAFVYELTLTTASGSQTKRFWASIGGNQYRPSGLGLDESNKTYAVYTANSPFVSFKLDYFENEWLGLIPTVKFNIPEGDEGSEAVLTIKTDIYSKDSSPFVLWTGGFGSSVLNLWDNFSKLSATYSGSFNYKTSPSNSINIGLDILYLKEEPIFDVILQYTKMYGLLWKVDDVNRTVTICRKSTYFKDYKIEDWNNKLDRSKDYIIEPVTFESKYVNFNYESIDGNKYNAYKDKYGVNYGSKKMKTSYEFNSSDTDLFEGINPSIISQRSYVNYSDLQEWNITKDTQPYISSVIDPIYRMESVDSDDEKAINESSWYFRLGNMPIETAQYITDDTDWMIKNKQFCYISHALMEEMIEANSDKVQEINELPLFGLVSKVNGRPFGCLFNCPKEDYTANKSVSDANGFYIFDNFWRSYIDERYNIQNKKLTGYFNITPWEYLGFDYNKFVLLDNQLFMVNKIFDYDINSSSTTKCELVQVTDINSYITDYVDFNNIIQPDEDEPISEYTFNAKSELNNNISAIGQTVAFTVESYKNVDGIVFPITPTYTSNANVSVVQVENDFVYTLSIEENVSASPKSFELNLTQPESNKTIKYTITQSAAKYEFESLLTSLVEPDGGLMTYVVSSKRNNQPWDIPINNIDVSGANGAYIDSIEPEGQVDGYYSIKVYVPKNESTESRTITITVVQPVSLQILTINTTQPGQIPSGGTTEFRLISQASMDSGFTAVNYELLFDATDTSKYVGGEARNVVVSLSTSKDGVGTFRTQQIGNVIVEGGSQVDKIGLLRGNGTGIIYFNVYYDNQLKSSFVPFQIGTDEPLPRTTEININI